MNDDEPRGEFQEEWKPTKNENPKFKCSCGSNEVMYRVWESSCGGYEDIQYNCKNCNRTWWVESSDS